MQQINPTSQLLTRGSVFLGGTVKMFLLCAALYLGTIFSLGIAYPWLSCALYRWETDNAIINGRKLHFDGKGFDLFKKYIKWLGLTFITLGVYKLWLSRNVLLWKTAHTHFAAENSGTSYYKCDVTEKIFMLIKYYAIVICTLALGSGIAYCYKACWTLNHTYINGIKLNFNGSAPQFIREGALCLFFTIITAGIYIFFVPVRLKRWQIAHTTIHCP